MRECKWIIVFAIDIMFSDRQVPIATCSSTALGAVQFEVAMKSQGEIETAICEGINHFEQHYMRRAPKDIHTHLIGDLLLVRLKGVLTAAEQQLVMSLSADKGRE